MDYQHIRCDKCGGIIGIYDKERFTCEKCGEQFSLIFEKCDTLMQNEKTGWIFPMIMKGKNEIRTKGYL